MFTLKRSGQAAPTPAKRVSQLTINKRAIAGAQEAHSRLSTVSASSSATAVNSAPKEEPTSPPLPRRPVAPPRDVIEVSDTEDAQPKDEEAPDENQAAVTPSAKRARGRPRKEDENGAPAKKRAATTAAKKAQQASAEAVEQSLLADVNFLCNLIATQANLFDRVQRAEMDLYVAQITYASQFPDGAPFDFQLQDIPDPLNLLRLDLSPYSACVEAILERILARRATE